MGIYFILIVLLVLWYRYTGILAYTVRNAGLTFERGRSYPTLYLPKPQRFWEKKVWGWPLIRVKDFYDKIITKIFNHVVVKKRHKIRIWEL